MNNQEYIKLIVNLLNRMDAKTLERIYNYANNIFVGRGASQAEILEQVESMLEDVKAAGLNPDDYATKVEPVQRFIVPPGGIDFIGKEM